MVVGRMLERTEQGDGLYMDLVWFGNVTGHVLTAYWTFQCGLGHITSPFDIYPPIAYNSHLKITFRSDSKQDISSSHS